MQSFFELINEFVEITGNNVVDSILLGIIGIVSFMVAFGFVGMIFDAVGAYDSDLMSDCHWIIRLIVFLGLSALSIAIMKFIKWIFGFPWWVYVIVAILLVAIIIFIYLLKYKRAKKKAVIVIDNKSSSNEENKLPIRIIDKDHCPRCGGLLVKRHGPYGDFYGCENFSIKDCRYTRKFK